jgi:hypothetical protein
VRSLAIVVGRFRVSLVTGGGPEADDRLVSLWLCWNESACFMHQLLQSLILSASLGALIGLIRQLGD